MTIAFYVVCGLCVLFAASTAFLWYRGKPVSKITQQDEEVRRILMVLFESTEAHGVTRRALAKSQADLQATKRALARSHIDLQNAELLLVAKRRDFRYILSRLSSGYCALLGRIYTDPSDYLKVEDYDSLRRLLRAGWTSKQTFSISREFARHLMDRWCVDVSAVPGESFYKHALRRLAAGEEPDWSLMD